MHHVVNIERDTLYIEWLKPRGGGGKVFHNILVTGFSMRKKIGPNRI